MIQHLIVRSNRYRYECTFLENNPGLVLAPAPAPVQALPVLPPVAAPGSAVLMASSLAPGGGPPSDAGALPADLLAPEAPAPAPALNPMSKGLGEAGAGEGTPDAPDGAEGAKRAREDVVQVAAESTPGKA